MSRVPGYLAPRRVPVCWTGTPRGYPAVKRTPGYPFKILVNTRKYPGIVFLNLAFTRLTRVLLLDITDTDNYAILYQVDARCL